MPAIVRRADPRLAVGALTLTAINMFGGFAVTRRMLAMFRK
jgi:NAD(P) transhydrogenase subunit alpha